MSINQLRWSGLTTAIGLMAGLSALGDTPDTRASTETIAAYFVNHHTSVLVGAVLMATAACALLVFGASLVERWASNGVNGRTLQSATTLMASLIFVLMVTVYVVLTYVVGSEAPDSAKPLFEMSLVATPVIAVVLALFYAATALATLRGDARRWFAYLTAALSPIMMMSAMSFAARGPFSPDVQQQVVFETLIAWLVTASIVLGRSSTASASLETQL